MAIPAPNFYPDFNITRVSHFILTVADLDCSREFYTQVVGLVVTAQEEDALYLRGVEESCHHSLILKKSSATPVCETVGFRVLTDLELEKAEKFFLKEGLPPEWIDVPGQGKTLRVADPAGIPLEFCARMDRLPSKATAMNEHIGASALRLDHAQLHSSDVEGALGFYNRMGFRVSDYVTAGNTVHGAFMYRNDGPYDFVLLTGPGPRLHHFAFVTRSHADMLRACDIAGALGYGEHVERGPGRHAMGHVQFVYIVDPDGHRVEVLLDAPHQQLDIEVEPVGYDVFGMHTLGGWGLPAQRSWFDDATEFAGVKPQSPRAEAPLFALEDYLGKRGAERALR